MEEINQKSTGAILFKEDEGYKLLKLKIKALEKKIEDLTREVNSLKK